MDSLDAIENVLGESAEPMHYQAITTHIIEQGLWQTEGKTPEATINARLSVDIKKHGDCSRFIRTGPGTFALRKWGQVEFVPIKKTGQHFDNEPSTRYSFTDAAELVLDKYADQRPMHYRTITERILELELVETHGQTPEATLYSLILTEIRRNTSRGLTPRFIQYGQGVVGLRKWIGEGLVYQIEQQNQDVQKKLLKHLLSLTPKEFEELIGRLLSEMGFEHIEVTRQVSDGGIDVRGTLVVGGVIRTKMAIQAKKWKHNVQSPIVQQVRGSLGTHEQGMIITTSDFSTGAVEEAARPNAVPVALVNGEQLVELLIEHQILVKRVPYELINLDIDGI